MTCLTFRIDFDISPIVPESHIEDFYSEMCEQLCVDIAGTHGHGKFHCQEYFSPHHLIMKIHCDEQTLLYSSLKFQDKEFATKIFGNRVEGRIKRL
jgi:hypothetical protein